MAVHASWPSHRESTPVDDCELPAPTMALPDLSDTDTALDFVLDVGRLSVLGTRKDISATSQASPAVRLDGLGVPPDPSLMNLSDSTTRKATSMVTLPLVIVLGLLAFGLVKWGKQKVSGVLVGIVFGLALGNDGCRPADPARGHVGVEDGGCGDQFGGEVMNPAATPGCARSG